jgi:uncharacterized protein (TIGR00251 family)
VGAPKTRLRVRVVPGASRSGVAGRHGESWKLRVCRPPERGKANAAVLELLSDTLRVPRRQLELVSGGGARDKVVEVTGLSLAEAEERLGAAAQDV